MEDYFFIICNYLALIGFTSSINYQIIRVLRTKSTKRILLKVLFIRLMSFGLFAIYLFHSKAWHGVYMQLIQLVLTFILIILVIYIRKYKKDEDNYYEEL